MRIKTHSKISLIFVLGIIIGFSLSFLFVFAINGKPIKNTKIDNELIFNNNFFIAPKIPDNITIFGDTLPMNDFQVREAIDFELVACMYRHASMILYMKRANRYFPAIEKYFAENDIPDDFKYLCVAESGLSNAVSPSNAVGFWQFLKSTGIEYGMTIDNYVDQRYDFEKSTEAAAMYLKEAYKRFGSWTLAAASYNMGMSGLQKDITTQKTNSYWDLYLNAETARYVYHIVALKIIFENPETYGYKLNEEDLYPILNTKSIIVESDIDDLVLFAKKNNISYKKLKYYNPWLRDKQLIIHNNKKYIIKLLNQ